MVCFTLCKAGECMDPGNEATSRVFVSSGDASWCWSPVSSPHSLSNVDLATIAGNLVATQPWTASPPVPMEDYK